MELMRTRRLHVRLAYVVRVDFRASIAYAERLIEHDVDTNKPQCSATLWRSSTRPPLARFICRCKANILAAPIVA